MRSRCVNLNLTEADRMSNHAYAISELCNRSLSPGGDLLLAQTLDALGPTNRLKNEMFVIMVTLF